MVLENLMPDSIPHGVYYGISSRTNPWKFDLCTGPHVSISYRNSYKQSLKSESGATDWFNVTSLQGDHITGYSYLSWDKSSHMLAACVVGWWHNDIYQFWYVDQIYMKSYNSFRLLGFKWGSYSPVPLAEDSVGTSLSIYANIPHFSWPQFHAISKHPASL